MPEAGAYFFSYLIPGSRTPEGRTEVPEASGGAGHLGVHS